MEQLPGVKPILHEGKISGAFDLLASDMAQVEFEGRVVLVLVADVTQMTVKTIKGDQTAFWTFKGADAAIVRDDGMKEYLAETLHLDSLQVPLDFADAKRGAELEGIYDDEGAFLGFKESDKPPPVVDVETGEVTRGVADEEEEDYVPSGPAPNAPKPPPVGTHIRHRDPALEKFLNEPASV